MKTNGNFTELKIDEVVYRDDLYPRFKPNPAKIQEYAEVVELLPPIEIDQHNILIDGYHRLKAHLTAKKDTIKCVVTNVRSEAHLEQLAVERNSQHGQQLTQDEKNTTLLSGGMCCPKMRYYNHYLYQDGHLRIGLKAKEMPRRSK